MTTYALIEELIRERQAMRVETAIKVIHEAYAGGKIERWQAEDLIELAKKYLY